MVIAPQFVSLSPSQNETEKERQHSTVMHSNKSSVVPRRSRRSVDFAVNDFNLALATPCDGGRGRFPTHQPSTLFSTRRRRARIYLVFPSVFLAPFQQTEYNPSLQRYNLYYTRLFSFENFHFTLKTIRVIL